MSSLLSGKTILVTGAGGPAIHGMITALKESGGAKEEELQMTEEDKKRIAEEADDGW